MVFKDVFKKYRKELKLSQTEIADDLHVSTSLVSQWERGICSPNPEMLESIADIFGISINELLGSFSNQQLKDLNLFRGFNMDKFIALTSEDRELFVAIANPIVDALFSRKTK